MIGMAYVAIPILLVIFARRRKDLPFPWMFWLFGAFLIGCASTHFMEVVTTYAPVYRFSGLVKLFTALAAWATVAALIPVVPRALALRNPEELHREIAERRRSEETLRAQTEVLGEQARLLDLTRESIFVRDLDGRLTYWNRGATEQYGWSREEALGQVSHQLLRTQFPESLRRIEEQVLREGFWEGELVHTRRDGSRVVSDSRWALQRDDHGRPKAILEINTDVTRRKQAEETLSSTEERFRLLVEGVTDYAIFLLDPEGRVVSWNPGAERIYGYTADEVSGRHFSNFYPPEEVARAYPAHELKVTAREGRYEDEGWRVRQDGSRFWANVVITALRDEQGNLRRFAKITRDVTERKRAAEKLQAFADRLERSNRELEEFASVASHDLQEPLRKIQAFGDRLQSKYGDGLTEQGRDYLRRMQHAAGRMSSLITDLLSFSRVTTKAQPFKAVDLGRVAREVVADLEERIGQTGGRVEVGELPAVEADPLQMRQLLQNLIGNALKFHRPGEAPVVRVRAEVLPPAPGNGRPDAPGLCRLTVEDNGIGFDEKYLDRIFNVFQRLHGRGEFEGTGMGLAICRKIVERHGGTITARSKEGQGATFIITLPVRQPKGEAPSDPDGETDHGVDGR